MDILDKIELNSRKFSADSDRNKKKLIGQFFTPKEIAKYMANYMSIKKRLIRILDPGAGSGILSCSILYEILENNIVNEVYVDLYEIDSEIIELLENNLCEMKILYEESGKKLIYTIKQVDFISFNSDKWKENSFSGKYDIVISNPPYRKIRKSDNESKLMNSIVYGQPNIYFIFMAMAIKLLKNNGQFIFITPRSYFCGSYFIEFRKWFLSNVNINNIDILDSRKNSFDEENVLQETVIINGFKNTNQKDHIKVSKINRFDLRNKVNSLNVEKNIVFEGKNNFYIKAPTNKDEYNSLKFIEKWTQSLESLDIKVSTGKVVPFRCEKYLSNDIYSSKDGAPLIWDINLKSGFFSWPVYYKRKYQVIYKESDTVENLNYLFIKRISSKEEKRRIQIVQYYKSMLDTDKIGIENHINYMYKVNGQLDKLEMIGLYIIFNSIIIDNYFKVLCGSTQVNATEINSMKLPSKEDIISLGKIGQDIDILSSDICDNILINYFK